MKKNVIFIVIDSLNAECLGTHYGQTTTPFIDELKKKSFVYHNMFSQGPFTEAALMPIITGNYTLANGGYVNKFEDADTNIYKEFHNLGYDVFHNFHPNNYDINSLSEMNEGYYITGFDFNIIWSYRFEYYSEKHKKSKLSQLDYYNISKNLELGLKSCHSFYLDLKNRHWRTKFIKPSSYETVDLDKNLKTLEYEIKQFEKEKITYIDELMSLGKAHQLFSLDIVEQKDVRLSPAWFHYIKEFYADFLAKSYETEKKLNKKNNKLDSAFVRNRLYLWLHDHDKEHMKEIARYYRNYNTMLKRDEFYRLEEDGKFDKAMPSMKTTFDFFLNWLDDKKSDLPFFAKIHVDDCHYKSTFYTYDSEDKSVIDEEFSIMKEYFNHLSENYKGSLTYDYSLLYMDYCMKNLVHNLEEKGIMKDTVLVFTADHGYSYSYKPFRENYVSNFYTENFNVPFLIYDPEQLPQESSELFSSIDILPTLLHLTNSKQIIDTQYKGESLLTSLGREFITIEYMGAGCPDLSGRPVKICARNKNIVLVYEAMVQFAFESGHICELYDLTKDPLMRKNLVYNYSYLENEVAKGMNVIAQRFSSIKSDLKKIEGKNI